VEKWFGFDNAQPTKMMKSLKKALKTRTRVCTEKTDMALETATFGSGCFWVTEAVFQQIRGVRNAQAGYTGGSVVAPTHEEVLAGHTGHVEAVRLQYDSQVVSYKHLLEVFWMVQEACTLREQASAQISASQLSSLIFFHTNEQKKIAQDLMKKSERERALRLGTEIKAASTFFVADHHHQSYYKNNRQEAFCLEHILPKILMTREYFKKRLAA
jgi:peptide-methionine (S)-S-oxide reductase